MSKQKKRPRSDYPSVTRTLRAFPRESVINPYAAPLEPIAQARIPCRCGKQFTPRWYDPLPFEFSPFQSADGRTWVPTSIPLICPYCNKATQLSIEQSTATNGRITLYGDESYELLKGGSGLTYVYAFFGVNPEQLPDIQKRLNDAKLRIRPGVDPKDWVLHAQEVRSSRFRQKHGITIDTGAINATLRDIASLVGTKTQGDQAIVSAAVCPPVKRPPDGTDFVRDRMLTLGLVGTIEFLTRNGFAPEFFMESQTTDHERGFIDYFVERVGRSLHHSPAFHFAARGQMIGLPVTVPKSSDIPELEIADLVAFAVRRYLARRLDGKSTELPLEDFGLIWWGVLTPKLYGTHRAVGFPWAHFFGNSK